MSIPAIQEHRRMELCGARITLDGEPANISGYRKKFAQVRKLKNGLGCEFAWATCDHIVKNRNGEFKS